MPSICSSRSEASAVRSATSTCAPGSSCRTACASETSTGSWPPACSAPTTFEPNSRSGINATTRAMLAQPGALLGADPPELLADGLGPAPHRVDLDASAARLADRELAVALGLLDQTERRVCSLRRSSVTKPVRHQQPPVPVGPGVGLGVAGDEQ